MCQQLVIYEQQTFDEQSHINIPFQTGCSTWDNQPEKIRPHSFLLTKRARFAGKVNNVVVVTIVVSVATSPAHVPSELNHRQVWLAKVLTEWQEPRDVNAGWRRPKAPASSRWSDRHSGLFGSDPYWNQPRWPWPLAAQRHSCWPLPTLITSHLNVQPRVTSCSTGLPVYMLP